MSAILRLAALTALSVWMAVRRRPRSRRRTARRKGLSPAWSPQRAKGKGEYWIEVKADGEEKGRKYFPHWRGGAPKDGGGPDKEMVKIKEVPLKARVRLEWSFEERPRVEKIEVLRKEKE